MFIGADRVEMVRAVGRVAAERDVDALRQQLRHPAVSAQPLPSFIAVTGHIATLRAGAGDGVDLGLVQPEARAPAARSARARPIDSRYSVGVRAVLGR